MKKEVITIIPTINRINTIKRAINSVLNQTVLPKELIIVYEKYAKNYKELESIVKNINSSIISLIPNKRSNNLSGNINTALNYISQKYKNNLHNLFISVLDDDDEYLPQFIENCLSEIKNERIIGVFAPIIWKRETGDKIYYLKKENLTPNEFFIGNPGVQGSNLFIRGDVFVKLKFDEKLISTTDRDFMIRFLMYKNKYNKEIVVLDKPLVIYHADEKIDRLTTNIYKKEIGLRTFYAKYTSLFSEKELKLSLERAKKLFNYLHNSTKKKIVIGIAFKNEINSIRRTVASIFNQKNIKRDIILLIINDGSYDDLKKAIKEYLEKENLFIHSVNLNNVSKIRNYTIELAKEIFPDVEYIGRLDADDYLVDEEVLSKLETIMDKYNPDVIIAGNKLSLKNKILQRTNYASKNLLNKQYLNDILYKMSKGIAINELPSCNIFIKPTVNIRYKDVTSAEDHWFLVDIILNQEKYNIYVAEDILYCVYSLNGNVTKLNKSRGIHLESRKKLLSYFKERIKTNEKKK